MQLVQILLPLTDNDGKPFAANLFAQVRRELTERFGGLTAFTRAPAEGAWKDAGETQHDDIIVLEVMTESLDRAWWTKYRQELELRFDQDEIVIRAQEITLL
jgi:hypothetical protein